MNKEWFSDYKEQILLNNMQEARNVILDNIDKLMQYMTVIIILKIIIKIYWMQIKI